MKTPEKILSENLGIVDNQSYEVFQAKDSIVNCMQQYASQFRPTPTEAEINEAADDAMLRADLPLDGENDFIMGFKECFIWLQNYQTNKET